MNRRSSGDFVAVAVSQRDEPQDMLIQQYNPLSGVEFSVWASRGLLIRSCVPKWLEFLLRVETRGVFPSRVSTQNFSI